MGRPQEKAPSPYRSESNPQPQNNQFTPESGGPYPRQDISPAAYEPTPSYPPGNGAAPQPQFQQPPPPQPQYPPNNSAYPPQPAPYPPNNPHPGFPSPQPVSYPPPNPSPAVPQQYPPASPHNPAASIPQQYPPDSPYKPAAAVPQQYPPPVSPHKPFQNNVAAPGIPVQQPYPSNSGTMPWTTGIFDCMDDPMNTFITAFVPCLTFGQIAEIIDNGHTSCTTSAIIYGAIGFVIGIPCLLSCTYRTKLRSKYSLMDAPAPDWVTHFFCEWCALCQEYRELKARGLDPELGSMASKHGEAAAASCHGASHASNHDGLSEAFNLSVHLQLFVFSPASVIVFGRLLCNWLLARVEKVVW